MSPLETAIEKVRQSFRARAAGRAADLRTALSAGDRERVVEIAHALAGTAGTIGFDAIGAQAREAERLLLVADPHGDPSAAVETLASSLEALSTELP